MTDFTSWTLDGTATAFSDGFTYSTLALNLVEPGGARGSAFAPAPLFLEFNQPFGFRFNFFIPVSIDLRGDGLTFTLAGTPGLGDGGSGLGYQGLGADSIAFAVDTFHFDSEPVSPSVQILQGGSVTPLAATVTGLGDSIRDPNYQWRAEIDYAPSGLVDNSGLLSFRIVHLNLGTFEVQSTIDFGALGMVGNPVHYGFTAANGAALDGHFITSAAPIPEPGSVALLLAGLGVVGWRARRRLWAR